MGNRPYWFGRACRVFLRPELHPFDELRTGAERFISAGLPQRPRRQMIGNEDGLHFEKQIKLGGRNAGMMDADKIFLEAQLDEAREVHALSPPCGHHLQREGSGVAEQLSRHD